MYIVGFVLSMYLCCDSVYFYTRVYFVYIIVVIFIVVVVVVVVVVVIYIILYYIWCYMSIRLPSYN